MSDAPPVPPAPPATDPPAVSPAPAVPAPQSGAPATPAAPPPPTNDAKDPAWLPGRLEQARRQERATLLKELGVEDGKDPRDIKSALEQYKAHQEAQKSELQKAQERAASLESAAKERDAYRARIESFTAQQLASLTAEQRAAVEGIAGNDPLKVASTIDLLRPTWSMQVSGASPVPVPAPTPLPAAPATSAPPAASPAPGKPKSKYDEWQDYEKAGKRNAAALFYNAHKHAIEQSRPA